MVKAMNEALKIPHFGYKDEIDMTKLVELRKQFKKLGEKRGTKVTYMPVILKACSLGLTQYPILNSNFDAEKETITYKVCESSHLRSCINPARDCSCDLTSFF